MKTITTLLATAALIAGIATASAQGTTRQMDEQAGGNSGSVERNPNGTTDGSKANPSPTTGAGTMGGANSTTKQDEKAGGNGRAVERDGMSGGANPSQSR